MKKLAQIDLYTGLILVCVVLLPICAWWCMKTNEAIDACKVAVREATRSGGYLEQIGALKKNIEIVNENRSGNDPMSPKTYFDGQIVAAAVGGGVASTDFNIIGPKSETLTLPGSKQKVDDYIIDIQWTNKEHVLKLGFIESLLWNCESGAGLGSNNGLQSIWKLQQLQIVNTSDDSLKSFDTPPPELQDRWAIRELKFARREPSK
ncbi:MAG: hypothetical protein KDC98_18940 [Planctomycetes bacterium]|nr:hypothetical protein [Planctomycetota bacterium]